MTPALLSSNAISSESARRPVARPQCNAASASDGRLREERLSGRCGDLPLFPG
jgi:hypothetical protein